MAGSVQFLMGQYASIMVGSGVDMSAYQPLCCPTSSLIVSDYYAKIDELVRVDMNTASSGLRVYLPNGAGKAGRRIGIKNESDEASKTVQVVTADGQLIDGMGGDVLAGKRFSIEYTWNGEGWVTTSWQVWS